MSELKLMVGDWVKCKGENICLTAGHLYEVSLDIHKVSPYQPIELTPEILEMVEGWECVSDTTYWLNYANKEGFRISMWLRDEQVAGFEKIYHWYYGDSFFEFKYLHTLQQLIRLFTGKEIDIEWEK